MGGCRVGAATAGGIENRRTAMSFGLMYWILMLLWFVFGLWSSWPNHYVVGGNLLLFILLLLLGWKVFGAPVHG